MLRIFKYLICAICLFASVSYAETDHKTHVVVAMPFKPGQPFDPNWYTPEYVDYIKNLLPADRYEVMGYFVSLQNIPTFLNDMKTLNEKEKVVVFNVCDGGEWDGYPGISVITMWKKHPVNGLVAMSGSDDDFIYNSDNKNKMNGFLAKAGLPSLPQVLIAPQDIGKVDLTALLAKEHLDKSWPLFCKLNIGAGALGIGSISVCHTMAELSAQLENMHKNFPKSDIIVQPYLPGPEYTVLVVKDKVYVGVQRDFHNRYNVMEEDYLHNTATVGEEITFHAAPERVNQLAVKAVQAIPGKAHYTRVDMRDDGKGNTYVIDINDRPGFGEPSTVKCMLNFHHLSEAQLLLNIIETSSK